MPLYRLLIVLSLVLLGRSVATQVSYSGVLGSVNETSRRQPLPGDASFELGSFIDDFVPTAANTAQWAGNWRAATRATYNPQVGFFSMQYIFTVNPASFPVGGAVYLWGFTDTTVQGEWLLLRNDRWKWPAANDLPGTAPVEWGVNDAGTAAVVGNITNSGAFTVFASVPQAPLPLLPYADWAVRTMPTRTAAERSTQADPDGDGYANALEYAMGTSPELANHGLVTPFVRTALGRSFFSVRLPLSPRADAAISAEISADLRAWTSSGVAQWLENPTPATIAFSESLELAQTPERRRFIRVRAMPR